MPSLLELVSKAETARRHAAAQVKLVQQEAAGLEAELLSQIRAAVSAAVLQIDLTSLVVEPLAPVDYSPRFDALETAVAVSAFVDKSKAVQQWIEAATRQVTVVVEQCFGSMPKHDLRPMIDEVKRSISGIVLPKFVFVTEWEFAINRDTNGFIENVKATAVEWGEPN